ncbi:MAG TPA: HAD family phosphatase [Blastocatellia bacterium]|nr:HAD family phosphatase [Blastocatellia bacterium]
MNLKAIIFDFNGVIVDDEPLHLELFRKVLREEGIFLSDEDYHEKYLGYDDRGCFTAVLCDNARTPDAASDMFIHELIERKAEYYRQAIQERMLLFPGVVELVRRCAAAYPLAIASGALRSEIEFVLERGAIREYFPVIVAAEDVSECKPDPEGYLKALEQLNATRSDVIAAHECLVIEDSIAGIEAAKAAGMKCLAVTNSYKAEELHAADKVVASLEAITLETLFAEQQFGGE